MHLADEGECAVEVRVPGDGTDRGDSRGGKRRAGVHEVLKPGLSRHAQHTLTRSYTPGRPSQILNSRTHTGHAVVVGGERGRA